MPTTAQSDRGWPLPARRGMLAMNWHDLAFLHWPVPVESLRPHIPPLLEIDTFDDQAWLGIVPFRMTGVRPRGCPALPWLSAFPELNVRTYVSHGGKDGVWFFSLDATNPLAVRVARRTFHLNYLDARITTTRRDGWIEYTSTRTHRGQRRAELAARYRSAGAVFRAHPGTIEWWLTARYCLYAADNRGRVYRGEIDHAPWPLAPGEVELQTNTMTEFLDLRLPDRAPLVHVVDRIDVVAWTLDRVV